MGREWYWGGRSSNSRRWSISEEDHRENPSVAAGCMSAFFHFFDFHPSHFKPSSSLTLPHDILPFPRGVEAPRNSLELDELASESWDIPIGVQIRTSGNGGKRALNLKDEFWSESPGLKTPNLVARLMGLDILPHEHGADYNKENGGVSDEGKERMRKKIGLVDITNTNRSISKRVKKMEPVLSATLWTKSPKEIVHEKLNSKPTNNLFPVKKLSPSPSASKIPHEQPCNYRKGSHKHRSQEGRDRNTVHCGAEESQYVKRIVSSSGVSTWFSPCNPLDPSLFHHLEITAAVDGAMRHRSNRKLMFHLVNEILRTHKFEGSQLAEKLCHEIGEFPRANCQVLEDIDALIDRDLPKAEFEISTMAEAETEGIAKAVECEILDSLLRQTAAIAFGGLDTDGVV